MNLRLTVIFMIGFFTLQVFDLPPVRKTMNARTCCGRMVCLCAHAKGAACDFRHKTAAKFQKPVKSAASHCHLQNQAPAPAPAAASAKIPDGRCFWTKAPCSSDAPASVLRGTAKDFIFSPASQRSQLDPREFIPAPAFRFLPLLRVQGIERPPRPAFFSR